jgi:hypothetical protein
MLSSSGRDSISPMLYQIRKAKLFKRKMAKTVTKRRR